MAIDAGQTEMLFSYGTLQLEAVQMGTFGRLLAGSSDRLPGFELAVLTVEDEAVIALSGKTQHTMARFTGRDSDVVPGFVFAVTPQEIEDADRYEVAAVQRVRVDLESGLRAWAYVDARDANPIRGQTATGSE
ncbi:MAG: gamma-glutamylcyclotransferase family protein [Acidobacteriota bacterium]